MLFRKWAVYASLCGAGLTCTASFAVSQGAGAGGKQADGPAISFTLPKDGEVTLGIYDEQGQLLRTVISSEPRSQGRISEVWDGLDQWGRPLPAGSYLLKGIYHPAITTSYMMTFGNPGNPPWPTADGRGDWLADESAPQAVASDGQWVFLAAPGAEKGSNIIAVDAIGQRQWGLLEPFAPSTVSLAVEGEFLYALFSGPQLTDATRAYKPGGTNATGRAILVCLNKRTGQPAKFSVTTPIKVIAKFPFKGETTGLWELRTKKSYSPATYSGQPRYSDADLGETTDAIGLAVANGRVYVAMHDDNQLLVFDANSGNQVDEIPVPSPAGLFAEANHSILAISDKHIVRINPSAKQMQAVVSSGLVAPRCVTEDAKGNIYVSDWGDSFQVKEYSAGGAAERSIGKAGGRPWVGAWDNDGMLVPTGVAVTADGKLWVAEDDSSPSRVSVWNAENGMFLREYLGPTAYGGPGSMIDPKDPTDANGMGTRFKISIPGRSWTPRAIMERRMDIDQPFAINGALPATPGQRMLYQDGQEYQTVVSFDGLTIHKRKGDLLTPVAAIGSLRIPDTGDGTGKTLWDSDLGRRLVPGFYPPFFAGKAGSNYTWSDSNGDGLVQPEEMQWMHALAGNDTYGPGTQPTAFTYWGMAIGDDWSLYFSGSFKNQSFIYRLDVKSWTAEGAPLYDIQDAKPIVVRSRALEPMGLFAAADGKVIATYAYESPASPNAIECFDRSGKSLWALRMPKPAPSGPGQGPKDILAQNVITEFHVPGIGNVLGSWLWHGNYHPYLFTDDGLYVSSLLDDTRVGPTAMFGESYENYYQDPQGLPYIIHGATDAYHVLRIDGLTKGGRFQQPFEYSQQDFEKAAGFRSLPPAKVVPKAIINIPWAAQPPKIDGSLSDWQMHNGVTLQGDKGRNAQVALSRDDSNLYLAFQVAKDRPFSNKGSNWQTLFLSGDCVDLMLATVAGGAHSEPVAGDVRLLFSTYQGKPVAVLYRPVVPDTAQPIQLMAARIDSIRQLSSARVAIVPNGNSYIVEASVPLAALGVDARERGTALAGDVGVVYADPAGTGRALRLYYYNKLTSITNDLTTEASLQPSQWGTVQLPLGPNLLRDGSFEGGFAANSDQGWYKASATNGAAATEGPESPHSGMQSLMLDQTTPIVYPASTVTGADYRAFLASGNNGAGGGAAVVEQRVAITAGQKYSLRFNYRTEQMQTEKQVPGQGRGYASLTAMVEWTGTGIPANQRYVGVLDDKISSATWTQATNASARYQLLPQPYLAPPGATGAIIRFRLATNAANILPKAFVDDVELVDASTGP